MRLNLLFPASLALPGLCCAALLVVPLRYDMRQDGADGAALSQERGAVAESNTTALRCSDRNAAGVGLRGEYFAQMALGGKVLLSRIDTTVDFGESLEWPAERAATRPQSARWQGWVKAPLSGRYRFHGGPGNRITVSSLPMAGRSAPDGASIELAAGSLYPIVMEAADLRGAKRVSLEWTAPHGVRYVIPRALLFLPTPKS